MFPVDFLFNWILKNKKWASIVGVILILFLVFRAGAVFERIQECSIGDVPSSNAWPQVNDSARMVCAADSFLVRVVKIDNSEVSLSVEVNGRIKNFVVSEGRSQPITDTRGGSYLLGVKDVNHDFTAVEIVLTKQSNYFFGYFFQGW